MRIVTLPNEKVVKKRRHRVGWFVAACLIAVVPIVLYFRPLPTATVALSVPTSIQGSAPTLSWPSGQVAFSAEGFDFLEGNNVDKVVSTASIAKVITALCILEKKPLNVGETGPVITMSAADVARYQTEVARDGTSFAVVEGDRLSEYDMLEAILLPSANNIADTAAIWAFGSLADYQTYAQSYVHAHGMSATTIGPDASGFDATTTSTPRDLVKLAKLAVKAPVLMEIVGKRTATIGAVVVNNHNTLVGSNGVTGLKTGRNDENSGGLLFTAKGSDASETVVLTGVVIDAGSLSAALNGTTQLIDELSGDFPTSVVVRKGQAIGTAQTAWGTKTAIISDGSLTLQHWSGSTVHTSYTLETVTGVTSTSVGVLRAKADGKQTTVTLSIRTPAQPPSIWWRIRHVR